MDAIETLMQDHRLIERTLDALVGFTAEVRRAAADDRAELAQFVRFIREFADALHHGKEEDVLFAAMVEAGFPRHGGPVAVMLMEHDQGRAYVRALADLAAQPGAWSDDDRERVVEAAQGYAQLLFAHIRKEDGVLYPMAEQRLPNELLARVERDCAALEAGNAAARGALVALAEALAARHPAAARAAPAQGRMGCCG